MPKQMIFEYKGKDHTVTWDRRLCIHAGECGRAKGELFVGGRDPWCDPDQADREDIGEIIARCPTGALALKAVSEPAPVENTAIIANDGPIYLTGDLDVDGATEDMPSASRRVALCRCGKSKKKPFCDNSHRVHGFKDAGAIGETGSDSIEGGGPLTVKRIPDGPLEVTGNLTLHSGSGRKAWQGEKAYLCRCGQSANKPFCDGAHSKAGFKAE